MTTAYDPAADFALPVIQGDDAALIQAAGELTSALARLAVLNMAPRYNLRERTMLSDACRDLLETISAGLVL